MPHVPQLRSMQQKKRMAKKLLAANGKLSPDTAADGGGAGANSTAC